ncbi:lysophospholipid acyltransferase family protein [Cognatishimia activa]|uniref:2-acyl-glycerophospho-ethanolamine acyltransferase n=1 Tax=Cognatishimia activa TaxID=1715691 RepID=A0A0P1IZ31_9RHOB|nr:lysophospholipid acyltransferase family protein [Cognatishimia activa]MEE2945469.1 lysophospholipid acyltransferase family protein [Pseudomonadota bacterium]CUJ35882.1 2-acyl-glycerophospho-ethanolamine acyltransferase [Cognatishimia activa]CUK27020.1 2-acyl-glycerophospho-ethanolamine acyltransferase [Cognatishimia activa]
MVRDISYAHSASTSAGEKMIRLMENTTGRLGLIKRADGYEKEVAQGGDFWQIMMDRYGLKVEVIGGSLDLIPREGPLLLIANHPYGILDGLVMGHLLSKLRGDFRILAHQVFRKAEDLNKIILPISFDETKDALKQNIETRKVALNYLKEGGAIGIFPGGTVSTAVKPFGMPMDPVWRGFTGQMVAKSEAQVVPIFFDGTTSRLFQLASHLHYTLRMGFLIREFRKRVGTSVRIVVGSPIERAEIDAFKGDRKHLMDFLRRRTYDLSPRPLDASAYGFEFEEKYKA